MSTIPARELRNDVSGVLRRVEAGQPFVVTVSGRPVARLVPLERSTWAPGRAFLDEVARVAADPALLDDLRHLAPDTTDDLPL